MRTTEIYIIAAVLINVHAEEGRISDKRLCGDPTCSHPVSLGKTLIQYHSDDSRLLSFGKNVEVTIYSKSAGSKPDLWGVEINGRRGYMPKGFVREYKILKSPLTYIVNTEEKDDTEKDEKSKITKKGTNPTPSISGSIELNNKSMDSDAEVPKLNSDEGSGREVIPGRTPSLEEVSARHSVSGDLSSSSFSGSGVSAEPLESEIAPKPEEISQPYEVVDGTTVYLGTDGSQSEATDPILQTVTPSPELNVKHDDLSSPSPEDDELTAEKTNSNEISQNENNHAESSEKEESSGHIYQYISSWMTEGSGNLEGKEDIDKKEDSVKDREGKEEEEEGEDYVEEEEEDYDDDDEEEDEEDEEGKNDRTEGEVNKENDTVLERNDLLRNAEEDGETKPEVESEDATDKVESFSSQEVKKENFEEHKVESENASDLTYGSGTSNKEDINEETVLANKENIEEIKQDSNGKELNDEEAGSGEYIPEDKNSEEVSETLPHEGKSELSNTNSSEEIPIDSLDVDDANDAVDSNIEKRVIEEILGKSMSPVEDGGEKNTASQETVNIELEVEENETPSTLSAINSTTQINDIKEPEEIDNIIESVDNHDKFDSETQNSFFKTESSDNLEKTSVSDVNSKFLQLEKSGPLSVGDNETESETSIEDSQADAEDTFEMVTSSSEEEILSVGEVTEPSVTEEVVVPIYEPSVEMTTIASSDISMEEKEEGGMLVEEVSDEQSGGYFPWVTNFFASLFGSSSSNVNVSEDSNESEVEDKTEDIFKTDDSEKVIRKREVFWESPNEKTSPEMTSATCKEPFGSSAGIDSECNELTGQQPNYMYKTKEKDSADRQKSEEDVLAMDLQKSFNTVICMVITGATVIIFSLGYFYIEKKRRDGTLVAKINELEKALLVSSKECLILKDDLQATKDKLLSVESSSLDSNETANSLNLEIEKYKMANAELEEQVASLEKELENATEAGLELNHMLTDFLSSQNSSETVMKSVEHLQKQLDSQQNTITSLTKSLSTKTAENESLQSDLNSAMEKINCLEEDVQKVNEHFTTILSEKLREEEEINEKRKLLDMQLNEISEKKNAEICELNKVIAKLQESINEQRESLVTKETEVLVLQDCLKHLKSDEDGEGDDKLQSLLDVGHIKAELKLRTIERDTLIEKLQGEEDARKLLEDHMKIVNEELKRLRESYEEADKEKTEAQTRLEVLSNYFKEKETQLQKELGLQEAICLQKEGDATSTYEQIKFLQDEIENYRSQNETLKKEILDQERSLKCQIASLEKKAHENWVAARQTERKLEESKQEASQLRNRLTIVEKNVTNTSINGEPTKINDRLTGDSNGELPTSPVHLGISLEDSSSSPQLFQHHDVLSSNPLGPTILPGPMMPPNPFVGLPPPGVFMPPPPPPPPVSQSPGAPYMPPPLPIFPDRRPPPLGRMSSPPPRRYSPPPPDPRRTFSPYDDCSPPPSPLPMRYRSPPPHEDEPSDRFRQHRSPPPPSHFKPYSSPAWDDSHGPTRSGFRPLPPSERRNSPREPKGPALSSGHSSDSLDKSSRHSGRV